MRDDISGTYFCKFLFTCAVVPPLPLSYTTYIHLIYLHMACYLVHSRLDSEFCTSELCSGLCFEIWLGDDYKTGLGPCAEVMGAGTLCLNCVYFQLWDIDINVWVFFSTTSSRFTCSCRVAGNKERNQLVRYWVNWVIDLCRVRGCNTFVAWVWTLRDLTCAVDFLFPIFPIPCLALPERL